ncbi:ribosomal-processing cysteine protease Prp [Staphylococcus lutrae]|uniref:Ribosomal processing cysteine protease Prp n=1 Tax=Staphylococcus lutrae TaxID=155085 RepID=A0AAC9WLF6_9STAP|nr:ribosomal-processing cysteine protease Prp [Staphylococcus lutrae]ARJ49952.1 hypothetical protein B5P37_00575 [Staphylococcus lutrae]PNZ38883.1 ribosomal-processing cysteine protease Prp [Staphylococcus lutrae]
MINVNVQLNDDGHITELIMEGHAEFGEHGQDLVCAGASAVLFGSVNAIIGLTSERPDIDYSDDGGYFHLRIVDTKNEQAQLILQSLLISLQTIEEEYNEYIKLNLK